MQKFERTVINSATGLPFASPTIDVFFPGTTTSATIYSDEGTTTKANPFTGDAQGRYNFYAPDGDYDIRISGTGLTTYTLADVTIADGKRITGLDEDDIYVLGNAFYNRQTGAFNRKNTALPATAIQFQGSDANIIFLWASAGANPITWRPIFSAFNPAVDGNTNYFQLATVLVGGTPAITTVGGDANISFIIRAKGIGLVSLEGNLLALVQANPTIADTETALLVRRNISGTQTVQRVSMGAVDSGGAGFKLLRVPN